MELFSEIFISSSEPKLIFNNLFSTCIPKDKINEIKKIKFININSS